MCVCTVSGELELKLVYIVRNNDPMRRSALYKKETPCLVCGSLTSNTVLHSSHKHLYTDLFLLHLAMAVKINCDVIKTKGQRNHDMHGHASYLSLKLLLH